MEKYGTPTRITGPAPQGRRVLLAVSQAILLSVLLAGCGGGDGNNGGSPPPGPDPDTTAPSVPQAVTATAQSPTDILVGWQASTDAGSGVAGYRVFRDGGAMPSRR